MINEGEKIRSYFSRNAETFDSIYSGKNGFFAKFLNRSFRSDIYERFRLAMRYSGDIRRKTVLDLGCGTGRYAVEFAKGGAAKVVGVDFVKNVKEKARIMAGQEGVGQICEFKAQDIFEYQPEEKFDIVISMGVFDYMKNPLAFLKRMLALSRAKLITSFPSYSVIRTPIRKLRYRLRDCPVYFYTRGRIETLLEQAGISRYDIIKIRGAGLDFFVHADI